MLLKKDEEDLKSTRVVDLRRFLPFTRLGGAGSLARCGFFSSVAIWGDHSLQCVVFSVVPSLVWRLGSRVPDSVTLKRVASSWIRHQSTSPALAGGFVTSGPPGKSRFLSFKDVN